MKTSVIRHRVADFLKQHHPFDALSDEDLLELAGSGRVKFHQTGEYIYRQGQTGLNLVWVVQQGRVDLLVDDAGAERLRGALGPGDMVGIERFNREGPSSYSARTSGDVILYGVDAGLFEQMLDRYPALQRYLTAHFEVLGISLADRVSWLDAAPPPLEFLRARVFTGRAGVTGVVDENGVGVGYLRAGDSAPRHFAGVLRRDFTTRKAVRTFLESRCEELAVTSDGTVAGVLDGVLTSGELALFCGHNPARLTGDIRSALSEAETGPLVALAREMVRSALTQPHDVDDCCRMGSAAGVALAEFQIGQAERQAVASGVARPEGGFAWFLSGSAARREVLLPECPELAAVYADSDAAARLWLESVGSLLKRCGPVPCRSLEQWRDLYRETIQRPLGESLYARREWFDLALLAGDAGLVDTLRDEILRQVQGNKAAVALLANDTLANLPPLTFFSGLVMETDGAQREDVDIDATAVHPIVDAARVFAIARGQMEKTNTLERLVDAMFEYPEQASVFIDAGVALRIALHTRTLAGQARISPTQLDKFQQRLLTTAFSSIQKLLEFTTSTFLPGTA